MPKVRRITTTLSLVRSYQGGTSQRTPEDALEVLNGVSKWKLDMKDQPIVSGEGGLLHEEDLPDVEFATYIPTIDGPKQVKANETTTYKITNYSLFDDYVVTPISGTVTMEGEDILYTATEPGSGGFILNDKTYSIEVLDGDTDE